MLTLLIALLTGCGLGYWAKTEAWGWGWVLCCGVGGFFVAQLAIGLLLRGAVKRRQDKIQSIMLNAQQKINKQLNLFQLKPPSGMRAAQQTLEKLQTDAARAALDATQEFRPLYKWNFLLKRQIAAMQGQLCFQLKEFKRADEYLEHAILADPQSIAVRMARFYRTEDARLDKFYRSKSRRAKGEAAAFLASVYAWIKLRQGDEKAALEALVAAKKNSDHPVLLENYSRLANGKARQFSNSGFGDMWYALYLEEPKVKPQRQRQGRPF